MRKIFTFLLASLFLSSSSFSQQNSALHFDGSDDHVQIPARNGVLTGSSITFEAWVKPSSLSGSYMPIVNKGDNSNYFLVYFDNMAMDPHDPQDIHLNVFVSNGSSNGQLSYPISSGWVNQWHHVAVTFNGSTLTLYVDGANVTSTSFNGSVPENGESIWFARGGSWDFFSGTLDEVRIWNIARTQAQIQAAMNNEILAGTTGLVAYYRFNQGTADGNNTSITVAEDHVAANQGTLINFAKTGSTSNFTTGYGSIAVLAIKENSFTAAKKGNAVQLNWKSIASEGSSIFTIERSPNGVDFSKIGAVHEISSTTEASYSFTDVTPLTTINYYRIKFSDARGRVSYTKTLLVNMSKAIAGVQAFPNPATSSLQLQITAPKGAVTVNLRDISGRTLQTLQLVSQGTTLYTTLDVSKLAKGLYTLTVGGENTVFLKQ